MSLPKTFCRLPGCDRPHRGGGLCSLHYQRVRNHGTTDLAPRPLRLPTPCSIEDCGRSVLARGFCSLHLERVYTHGDPLVTLLVRQHGDTCSIEGCGRPYNRKGLCRTHADRQAAHGSATIADSLAAAQGGCCSICGRPPRGRGHEARLHLDHDHRTGSRRGMLCGPCNKALGLLDENPAYLWAALGYLARHGRVEAVS